MRPRHEKEEFLESLWHMKEHGETGLDDLRAQTGEGYNRGIVEELLSEGLASIDENERSIELTAEGEAYARRLVRAHRLAERLIHDVLGTDSESSACEFEHMVNPELVDGICTLLGHPRECPHGMRIPEGDCCRLSVTSAESPVVPLTQLDVGLSARIAYVQCKDDLQMHRLEDLQIRPGAIVHLHQMYPSYVIECEGAQIALDRDVASNIRVWRPTQGVHEHEGRGRRGGRGRFGMGRRRRRKPTFP